MISFRMASCLIRMEDPAEAKQLAKARVFRGENFRKLAPDDRFYVPFQILKNPNYSNWWVKLVS